MSNKGGRYISRYCLSFFALFGIWLALVATFNWEELLVGAVLSAVTAVLGYRYMIPVGVNFSPRKLAYLIAYIPVFFWEMIKANFDVAYRVLHPRMPIKPGIVLIKTKLSSDSGKLALANSITLTPGTLTMDVRGDNLLIHWINVKSEKTEEATETIGGRFERFLRRVFS